MPFIMMLMLNCVFASEVISPEMMNMIKDKEGQIRADMHKKNWPDEKVFSAYLTVGDEFAFSSQSALASYFFKQAVALKKVKNKLPGYFRWCASLLALDDRPGLKNAVVQLEEYNKTQKASDSTLAQTIFYKFMSSDQLYNEFFDQKNAKLIQQGKSLGEAIIQHDIRIYFERKKYSEVTKLFDKEKLKTVRSDQGIVFDIAAYLENPKNATLQFLCSSDYEKYPHSRKGSYAMSLCGVLLTLQKGEKPETSEFDRIAAILKERAPDRMYLVNNLRTK